MTNIPCSVSLANLIFYHVEIVHTIAIQFTTNCELQIYTIKNVILIDFTSLKATCTAHLIKV